MNKNSRKICCIFQIGAASNSFQEVNETDLLWLVEPRSFSLNKLIRLSGHRTQTVFPEEVGAFESEKTSFYPDLWANFLNSSCKKRFSPNVVPFKDLRKNLTIFTHGQEDVKQKGDKKWDENTKWKWNIRMVCSSQERVLEVRFESLKKEWI